jgi:hypothetical protein
MSLACSRPSAGSAAFESRTDHGETGGGTMHSLVQPLWRQLLQQGAHNGTIAWSIRGPLHPRRGLRFHALGKAYGDLECASVGQSILAGSAWCRDELGHIGPEALESQLGIQRPVIRAAPQR